MPDLNDLANVTPAYIENIITRSLRRLGVERLDAVQFHWWDYSVPGMVDVAGELVRLQEKGLIRLISTTNFNAVELRKLIDAGIPVATNQCQYSVLDRRPAMRLERLCRETGVKLLCYGTVAGGFMSEKWLGAPKPDHFENRSLVKYALVIEDSLRWEGFQALLALMKEIGDPLGLSIANVSTLWTLSRPEVAAAIIGTRSSRHVDRERRAHRPHPAARGRRPHRRLPRGLSDGRRRLLRPRAPRRLEAPRHHAHEPRQQRRREVIAEGNSI